MFGVGIDILMISRIRSWKHDDDMLAYVFTPEERTIAMKKRDPDRCFAKIFAAKEAFLKAIGTGWSRGIGWKDIEVTQKSGKISFTLHRQAKELCHNIKVFVSVSCEDSVAVAMVAISDTQD
jgi:holo-[acyl-carrier protein] synthase